MIFVIRIDVFNIYYGVNYKKVNQFFYFIIVFYICNQIIIV